MSFVNPSKGVPLLILNPLNQLIFYCSVITSHWAFEVNQQKNLLNTSSVQMFETAAKAQRETYHSSQCDQTI